MVEDNPFINPNRKSSNSGGILDIDKIIEQEKVHAHKGALPEPVPAPAPPPISQPASPLPAEEPDILPPSVEPDVSPPITLEPTPTDLAEQRPEVEDLPEVRTVPQAEELVDDEPSEANDAAAYDDEPEPEVEPELEPEADVTTWQPPTRRIPRIERPTLDNLNPDESPSDDEVSQSTDDIVLGASKHTPNRRNLILIIIAGLLVIGAIFLIPRLINGGVLINTGSSNPSSSDVPVTAGLSRDVKMTKVKDGLEADSPEVWQATFTVDSTDITLTVDCKPKSTGGTSPNLSCVGSGSSDGVVDGTFVKPFTAGEGWTYAGADYGYCFSFADKVSAKTVQSELYGSSGIQLFYMADDFKICSKKAGNPDNTPKGTPCDSQTYCPAVRLRTIK
jgi:hypothetical protein